MTNHFTDLGFEIAGAEDLTDLLLRVAGSADEFPLDNGGTLLRWGVGAGIELWIQVHPSGELVGVHPFFLGPTRLQFLVDSVDVSTGESQDAALMGWVGPHCSPEREEPGAYPMRFDLPAYPLGVEDLHRGSICELQVSAFADEVALYEDEAEFDRAEEPEGEEARFSTQSFVPIGLIPPYDDEDDDASGHRLLAPNEDFQPAAEAFFSGTITRCEERINPFTQSPFWWLQIVTYGAEYDAVVDPALLSRDPRPGDIVQGQFWMAARIVESELVS